MHIYFLILYKEQNLEHVSIVEDRGSARFHTFHSDLLGHQIAGTYTFMD